jgi:8-oxo-dGTP diphosphatase
VVALGAGQALGGGVVAPAGEGIAPRRRQSIGPSAIITSVHEDPIPAPQSLPDYPIPRIPASAGALIRDKAGRLLILKPNYKKGWSLPGGQVDENGESPWDACRRETLEECGLEVKRARLVCVDFLHARPKRPGGVRFLFDCGMFSEHELGSIRLQEAEIEDYRLAEMAQALTLLSGPLRRRVSAAAGADRCLYLEDGRPIEGVGG